MKSNSMLILLVLKRKKKKKKRNKENMPGLSIFMWELHGQLGKGGPERVKKTPWNPRSISSLSPQVQMHGMCWNPAASLPLACCGSEPLLTGTNILGNQSSVPEVPWVSGDASTAPLQTPVWSTRILSLEGEGDPYPLVSVASLFTFPRLDFS